MEAPRKSNVTYHFFDTKIGPLRQIKALITLDHVGLFRDTYGNILPMVEDLDASQRSLIHTCLQFYDPQLRCFTFQDFQLAPLLEEYAMILGVPLQHCVPFNSDIPPPEHKDIAKALHLEVFVVKENLSSKGGLSGFHLDFVVDKAEECVAQGNWEAVYALLALSVYGIMLFADEPKFVSMSAIHIFLLKNPVPTLLGDFYFSVHNKNEKRRGRLVRCCAPLFHKWLVGHLPSDDAFLNPHQARNWARRLVVLTAKDIRWCNQNTKGGDFVVSCGKYPNVTLLGMKGCINYNPILLRRQLGYALTHAPKDQDLVESFYFPVQDNLELVKQAAGAWRNIQTKGATVYGKCNNISSSQYDSWLRERARITRLPFSMGEPSDPVIVESISMVEYKSLKQEKGKANKLNAKLSEGLRKTLCAKKEAEREVQRLNELQKQRNERIAEDADYIPKVCSGEDILKKACKAAKEQLGRAEYRLIERQQRWEGLFDRRRQVEIEIRAENEQLKSKENEQHETLRLVEQEIVELKIRAGVKRTKEQDKYKKLEEVVKTRNLLIQGLTEHPNDPVTEALLKEVRDDSFGLDV
ncbi:uncharacterized protein LOC127122060 [Lathyrus oleraceus]|uniref:uncharacterized protein LOC127122060 n=1 Tax=Pisum sativum TaxID=3888 RepID=UPI0021D1D37B|nr:uncharacterized protein LOC127122060 [Pisum sativum]